jgi:protein-L-isoaspartate(D-aspartate) O-methyltransferase
MVEEQLVRRGIRDSRVLDAMSRIERHRFVPEPHLVNAYGDFPVPLGVEQTLSQPYIVALMTEALGLEGHERILEIGTGSGYQTAVLAELARVVYTVEVVPELSDGARETLKELGYENVRFRVGDGRQGWPEEAPFDGILAAAAPLTVPPPLREQLSRTGRLVIPVGPSEEQELELHVRDASGPDGFRVRSLGAVRFVPLV